MLALLRRFLARADGSIAVVAAIIIVVLGIGTGLAVDYARGAQTRSAVAQALDAAAIAVARGLATGEITQAQAQARAQALFEANLDNNRLTDVAVASFVATIDPRAGTIRLSAQTTMPSTFLNIAGISELKAGAASEVQYELTDIEMALVLDVTGSMRGSKIAALRLAAADAINILLPAGGTSDRVRIGVVPFSCAVNVGPYAAAVTNGGVLTGTAEGFWTSENCDQRSAATDGRRNADNLNPCATERTSSVYTDAAPSSARFATESTWCPGQSIVPLTNDRNTLLTAVGNLEARGYTAGHLGAAWGWYELSPQWSSVWPAGSDPAPYGDPDVRKILVLMTDGMFNRQYSGTSSATQATQLCTNAKSQGILIYTISFFQPTDDQSQRPGAESIMRSCASRADMFYTPESGTELRQAFQSIASSVRQMWLSR